MAEPKLLQLFRAAVTRAVLPFENTDAYHPRYNATAVHIETKYCTYILHTATIHHNTHLLIPTLSLSRTQTTPCDSSCEKSTIQQIYKQLHTFTHSTSCSIIIMVGPSPQLIFLVAAATTIIKTMTLHLQYSPRAIQVFALVLRRNIRYTLGFQYQ